MVGCPVPVYGIEVPAEEKEDLRIRQKYLGQKQKQKSDRGFFFLLFLKNNNNNKIIMVIKISCIREE